MIKNADSEFKKSGINFKPEKKYSKFYRRSSKERASHLVRSRTNNDIAAFRYKDE